MPETCLLLSFAPARPAQDLSSLCAELAQQERGALAWSLAGDRILSRFRHPSGAVDVMQRLRERWHALSAAIHPEPHGAEQLLLLAQPGQALLSGRTVALLPATLALLDLGFHRPRNLQDAIRVFALPGSPSEPLKSLDTLPNNLPVQFTSFVGREAEMAMLEQHLQSARLVTLVGPGGVGKTRLAVQAAAALLDRYEDGAWFVPLEAVQSPDQLPQAVAAAIGLLSELQQTEAGSWLTALKRAAAQRRFLLLLDNCEHLIGECAMLAHQLLAACPGMSILCTSREPLRIGGEVAVDVAPLAVPAAVRLFGERAGSIQPGFAVSRQNERDVAEICTQLDGIPLAIELAAARVSVLAPAELAARLRDRFPLLSSRNRLARPRHQTLRAAVEWSHQLLSEAEQILWRRLSVFAGGFTLEAAEEVAPGGPLEQADILPLLAVLADKSLLRVDRSGGAVRYAMLETIREFGRERLVQAGEEGEVRGRHLAWLSGWVRRSEAKFTGPEQAEWFQQLDQEYGNIQAALDWSAADPAAASSGLRLAGDLGYYWLRGRMLGGFQAISKLLPLPELQGASVERVSALSVAGSLAMHVGEDDRARHLLEEGLLLAQEIGDRREQGNLQNNLGQLAFHEGRLPEAADHYRQSLAIFRELDFPEGVFINLNNLAHIRLHLGDLATAGALIDEALAGWRSLNSPAWFGAALERAAIQRVLTGRLDEARELLSEGLAIAVKLQDAELSIACAERISYWLLMRGRADAAAQLLDAAESLRAAYSITRPGWERPLHARLVDSLRDRLGAAAWDERASAGQPVALEALWEKAQEWLETPRLPHGGAPGGLTPRELEVVRLVAQGLPDREVAAHLFLSRFTVNNHLRNIFGKLGISSRSALIPWAYAHGLGHPEAVPTTNG